MSAITQGWSVIKLGLPALSTLVLVFFSVLPLGLPHLAEIMPALALMAVYFWSLHRPDTMPPLLVFGLGLLQDILTGGPLGLMAAMLLVVRQLVLSQRNLILSQGFVSSWMAFSIVYVPVLLGAWTIASLWYGSTLPVIPFLVHGFLTVAIYPLFYALFARLREVV